MKAFKVKVQGMNCYLIEGRITKDDIPKGFHWYGCRHSETDWSLPQTIEKKNTWANHFGYLLTPKPLKFKTFDDMMYFPNKQKQVIYSQEQITFKPKELTE